MRILVVLLVPLLVAAVPATPVAAAGISGAPTDPTPRAPNAIEAAYEFRLHSDVDAFSLSATFQVHEAAVRSYGVAAQTIRDGGVAIRSEFERQFREAVTNELSSTFLEATPTSVAMRFLYGQSDNDLDPYQPPIVVLMEARIPITAALLGVHSAKFTDGPTLASAFLLSGGRAVIDRSIAVPPGVRSTIEVVVPEFIRLSSATEPNATRIRFPADNFDNPTPATRRITFAVALRSDAVPANVLVGPRVIAKFVAHDETPLWAKAIPWTSGRYSADLDLWIEVPSLAASYFGHAPLPSNLKASHYSADLLRIALRERLVTAEDVHTFFASLIEDSLKEGFGEEATIKMDIQAFRDSVGQPIGGPDGRTIAPLRIHATAYLPLKAEKMVLGSGLAQTLGTITGIPAAFPVSNQGSWILDLSLFYPEGVRVHVEDTAGIAAKATSGDREGVRVLLHPGEETGVKVHGRPPFDPAVLLIGLLEIALLAVGVVWGFFRARSSLAAKRRALARPRL